MKILSSSLAGVLAVALVGGGVMNAAYASDVKQKKEQKKMIKQKVDQGIRIFRQKTRGSSAKIKVRTTPGGSGPMQSTTVTCVSTDKAGQKNCMDAANTMQKNGWSCSSVEGGTECTT